MSCHECEEILSAMLDGVASSAEQAAAAAHMGACDACRAYGEGLRQDREALRALPAEVPRLPDRLVRAHRAPAVALLARAAVLALVFSAGLALGLRLRAPSHPDPVSAPMALPPAPAPPMALAEWRIYPRGSSASAHAVPQRSE